ncbi:hypothetical protein B0T21DRAFT_290012 [Apiosordaria backusii]|uniref:Ubiquitin carboxyl-terminal hydrolase n=1 Tax=Apiosordaria backusii TaxID=314023 RepID=A0AA40BKC7_9PEZI|nr:hypothetical protein B0T21DRAFT_290012 [Apiosordaria backusii]
MSNPDPPPSAPAFIPLEANPELMTTLLRNLGMSSSLALHDVYSLTDPDLLSFIPRPCHALLLVFPITPTYESHRLAEDSLLSDHTPTPDYPVTWFKQTIRNACGLIALLHAVSNGEVVSNFIEPNSDLERIIQTALPLDTVGRAKLLEQEEALARAHRQAAEGGDTAAPGAEEQVDLHYVAFVKGRDGGLWEMDGRRRGPIKRGELENGEDVLSEKGLVLGARKFLEREGGDLRFSAVALAGSYD